MPGSAIPSALGGQDYVYHISLHSFKLTSWNSTQKNKTKIYTNIIILMCACTRYVFNYHDIYSQGADYSFFPHEIVSTAYQKLFFFKYYAG